MFDSTLFWIWLWVAGFLFSFAISAIDNPHTADINRHGIYGWGFLTIVYFIFWPVWLMVFVTSLVLSLIVRKL